MLGVTTRYNLFVSAVLLKALRTSLGTKGSLMGIGFWLDHAKGSEFCSD